MATTPHTLAQQLAHIAQQLNQAINTALATEHTNDPWQQHLETCRKTLLPTLTPAEFADMYAQTIVYTLFATRVIPLCPSVSSVFSVVDSCVQNKDSRIAWLVDDCARLLERTDMSEVLRDFGKATMQQDPVVHFYEDFLAAYDPKTREMRGVYYTPEPVVSYIVRSVDHLLQTHFSKSLGLADGDTIILDPATGTATFLHAVVQHIYTTLQGMGMASAWDSYVAEKLLPRLFGFELLMAPYTIAHLKLSMLLHQLGYTFGSDERLGIYLTNTLSNAPTGQQAMPFAQFIAEEGQAANAVKQRKPVMVVIGNPPYSGHSANKGAWIDDLLHGKLPDGTKTENYYHVDDKPLGERNPKWLQDDYVKFIRFGQWRINQTGEGILAFISNNGYLDNPTFRGMRESLLREFDTIYILNLHGSSRKKERTHDGSLDENVFDIQQGVAIGIFVKQRTAQDQNHATVHYADIWGKRTEKYTELAAQDIQNTDWQTVSPSSPWYLFIPQNTHLKAIYERESIVTQMMPIHSVGIATGQDAATIGYTYQEAEKLAQQHHLARDVLTEIRYRPFDNRFVVYHKHVVTRPRTKVMVHINKHDNIGLVFQRGCSSAESVHSPQVATSIIDHGVSYPSNRAISYIAPLYLYPNGNEHPDLFDFHNGRRPNLSASFVADVEQRLGLTFIPDGTGDVHTTVGPEDIFHYLYAVLHSPTYRTNYAEFLRIDFPRIPITNDTGVFATLAAHGAALVDLHLLRLPGSTGVGGAGGAACLSNPSAQGITQHGVTNTPIAHMRYDEQHQHVYIAKDAYFAGIEPATWAMQIGGYQPLHKWLKDRKGRTLSFDDALHYMRMVIALRETRRIMAEIDAVMRF